MGVKVTYTCDVCGLKILEGHQELYMVVLNVQARNEAGIDEKTYHVHNDRDHSCMGMVWNLLEKNRK